MHFNGEMLKCHYKQKKKKKKKKKKKTWVGLSPSESNVHVYYHHIKISSEAAWQTKPNFIESI